MKIPVSDLKAGAQVKGVTISDLGSGNQPLDMVPYKKDGHEFILIANSSFGVVKLHADNLGQYKPIDSPTVVDVAGAPYDKISALTNVRHLTPFDSGNAVMLTRNARHIAASDCGKSHKYASPSLSSTSGEGRSTAAVPRCARATPQVRQNAAA